MAGLHEGRVVWVTGAASGIGRALVEELCAEGGRAVASDLTGADLTWADGDERIATLAGDATDPAHDDAAVDLAVERFGGLDGAALNAGVPGRVDLFEGPLDGFDRCIVVNVRAVVLGIRAAARVLGDGGAIVVTASTSGLRGDPGMWAYNAAKAAVINLVRATCMDLAPKGIRINAVCPGPTETGMTAGIIDDGETYHDLRRRIPLQRWGRAADVAAAMSFLLSPKAAHITGAHLPVDGGISANAGQFTPPGPA